MATQGGETDEEYSDDPIKLIDFEQKRVNTLKILRNNCQPGDLTDVDVVSDSVPLSKYKKVCFVLPASFFTISKNVELLNGCRPVAVKIVDCIKHRSYNKKNIRITDTDSDIIIIDDEINEESLENVCENNIEDCVIISDSEKEEPDSSFDEQMGKPKIRPVDITSYIRNNKININNSVQRTPETLQPIKKSEKDNGILQNENRIDFKKNKGLVGLRIVQRAKVDDRSKVGQKIVESVNEDKIKNCSNIEKKKSNKVDGKTSHSSKPVYRDEILKVSGKSKLLESNTTNKIEKQPENNASTFNVKHSITNREKLRPNNTNSSKVDKETEKPSNVPIEVNLSSKLDKQKSSTDTSEKRKKSLEPKKTKKNKKKECISKYFKDVWDKDLRLALEPDTIQLKKLNRSLKYFKDKLKIDKRKSLKENIKCLNDNNDGKPNNNKSIEKLKKKTKDREKSKKKDSIVSDNTKKNKTHNKSMPSLLLDEQIATGKSQIEDNVSSKSTHKKTSEILSKNKCMGVKGKSGVQLISNPKNDVVINEKTGKDSSKLVVNQPATQNKQDKKGERKKNNSKTANLGLKRVVFDKDKPISTSAVHNRINANVMYKDKTSTSIPTDVNKQLQADKPLTLTLKPTATQETINQNNSHPLNQNQNEDLCNEDLRKSESLAKYLFFLQSLNPNLVEGNLSLKHAVKPGECILSYVNGKQQVPKDPKTHTVSIGDVQESSNSTGNNTSSATAPMDSQQIHNQPSNHGLEPSAQTMPNNSTNDCSKPDDVKISDKTFVDKMINSSTQDIPPNSNLIKKIDTATLIKTKNSTNDCNKPDAVKKSDITFVDNMTNSSAQDIPQNSNLIKKIDTATSIKTNNSTNDCNKPDAVKKSYKTFVDKMTNSSTQDIPQNSNLVKKIDTATSIKTNNSTNDCNKPDAVKKSYKTFVHNMTNSSTQDIPQNSNLIKKIDAATSIKTNNSTNDCNKPDAVKKSDKIFDNNMTNSSTQDIPQNSNLVKEIDTTATSTSIKSEISIKQEDSSESSFVPPINAAQQTASQGRIFEEHREPIQAFVTNRKDHKGILGIAPRVNMKTIKNLNTFPHGVIHCAPIYHGAPQNMPQVDQNQFGFYHPPQGKDMSHAQPPMSLPVPQMSQPLPQMPQSSPKILHHSQQLSQPLQQISQPSRQMPQPSRQMPQPSPQISQLSPQISQLSPQIPQLSPQISQPSRQMPQPSRQMPQPLRHMSQHSQQVPQPLTQMSQTSPEILENSQQMSQPLPRISQPSQQMPQPSRQMSQTLPEILQHSQQMSQPSPQISQPSRQIPESSRQMPQSSRKKPQPSQGVPQTPPEILHHLQQMSQPSPQISQPSPQISQLSRQMPPSSRQMPQPARQIPQPPQRVPQPLLQMSQTSPEVLQHSQQMSQPSPQISQPSRQIPQSTRQMPQPSRKKPQPSQRVPQTSPEILQHLQQMSQPSPQISQPSPQISQPSPQISQLSRQMPLSSRQMPQPSRQMPQPSQQAPQPLPRMSLTSPEILQHSQQMSQPSPQISQSSRQMPQPSRQMPHPLRQMPQPLRQMPQHSQQMPQSSQQMSHSPPQMSCLAPQMSLPPTQMWHSTPQISPQFRQVSPQMSHNVQAPLWCPPPQMPPQSSQMYHPVLQKSHSQLRMTPPRHEMSNCNLRMSYPQTQNLDLYACEQCQNDFPQMSNLPPQIMHPPSGVLHRHQQMPHFLQCLSNHPRQVLHPLPTSFHTKKPTWNPSQQLSTTQSQISHLPQQLSNPSVKYENAAQSLSGSTIIGRNNDGVVRKINIVAAHAKGLPTTTEAKSNNEDVTPVESEQEMFEELCKITTLESPMKEDSTSKKDLKRKLSKDVKIDESTPNRRPRISPMLKKCADALQDLKKNSERVSPVPQKGYSPPILPIDTFEKTFEILAQANIELSDNRNFGPIKIKLNPSSRKRRCVSFDEKRDNAKKISIDEYKKRSTGKDDKAIDFVVQHRKDDKNSGQTPDQDLGYDSDTTM